MSKLLLLVDVNGGMPSAALSTWTTQVMASENVRHQGRIRWGFDVFSSAGDMPLQSEKSTRKFVPSVAVHANGAADGPREHATAQTEGVHAV